MFDVTLTDYPTEIHFILIVTCAMAVHAAGKPNVIFILADDMGYGDVSCLNKESKLKILHMDRLAAALIRNGRSTPGKPQTNEGIIPNLPKEIE